MIALKYIQPLAVLLITLSQCGKSEKSCPDICTCALDSKGRNVVQCNQGGYTGSISSYFVGMSPNTEVIKISAPEDNMNALTMSPEFASFKKLEEVHITRSNIPILGMHFFYSCKRMEVLNLSHNNITQPLDHNFRGLDSLRRLLLDDNRISSLPSGTFRYLRSLHGLSLKRNRIEVMMPRIFEGLAKLQVLKLSGNPLGFLPPEVFKDIPELQVLECRACALTAIDTHVFRLIPNVHALDLGENEIVHISADQFHDLLQIKHLQLDSNMIELVPDKTFMRQLSLSTLNFSHNQISRVSVHAFDHLTSLSDLDLGYNKLDHLKPAVFNPVSMSLQRLVLSGNRIPVEEVQEIFAKSGAVREVHVAEMGWADVPHNFVPNSLTTVNLAHNHLSYIPADLITSNLVDLDLSRNLFRGLDEDTVKRVTNIPKLNLDGNPWTCDMCHILPLHQAVNRSKTIYNVRCSSPDPHEHKLLGHLRSEHLSWCTVPSSYSADGVNFFLTRSESTIGVIAAGASLCLLSITTMAALIALLYSRRHTAKYYTHEEKRGESGDPIYEGVDTKVPFTEKLSFTFPLELNGDGERKISVATIDEIKKEHVKDIIE